MGLLNRVVDGDPIDAALQLARLIVKNAPLSLAASLAMTRCGADAPVEVCWLENDRILRELIASNDAEEGARAFAEKRLPRWTGT